MRDSEPVNEIRGDIADGVKAGVARFGDTLKMARLRNRATAEYADVNASVWSHRHRGFVLSFTGCPAV